MKTETDRTHLLFLIQQQIFCFGCKGSIDVRSAVIWAAKDGREYAICGRCEKRIQAFKRKGMVKA